MKSLTTEQVNWRDETRIKFVIVGMVQAFEYCINFPLDDIGKINLENGSYSFNTYPKMNIKFYQGIWLCFGCAVVEKDGNRTGRRLHPFNYSENVIFSIKYFKGIIKTEIRRVESLTSTGL